MGGEVAVGTRLAEIGGARLRALPPAAARVLDIVAVGAPLELRSLSDGEQAELDVLEAGGIVEVRVDERRRYADLAHPLHGEVVRDALPGGRRQQLKNRLAEAVQASGARRAGDELRVAMWRLESPGEVAPELFVRAAGEALMALD